MKQYSIGEFAKKIGTTVQTLRNWDKTDKLKPNFVSPSGHRYYSQVDNMKCYLIAKRKPFEIITDIGSGINYNKKGLNELINKVINYEVESVVVLYKDRLLRFGYELLDNIFEKYGTTIEIIDNTPKTDNQELLEDLIQIITVFSCKLQGKRANKTKQMIQDLKQNEDFKD